MTRTSVERKAKQTIIARRRAIAIFTTAHRRSSRCSRNGFDVSLSGNSRNLKMSRKAMSRSARVQRKKTARSQPRTNGERVRIANLVLRNHSPEFIGRYGATFENRFTFFPIVNRGTFDRPHQKKIAMLVGQTSRSKKVTERNQFAVRCQIVT